MGRKYVLPLFIGFLGMFVCHIIILFAFGNGVRFPIYLYTYPIIYPIIAMLLTLTKGELWFTNGLLVCIVPLLYWYLLLWDDGKIKLEYFNLFHDTGMLLIMPFTTVLSILFAFIAGKIKINLVK